MHTHCAECEQIATEMWTAFLKISTEPRGVVLYVSRLFLSEADLARLKELWQQSGFGVAQNKFMAHRIATWACACAIRDELERNQSVKQRLSQGFAMQRRRAANRWAAVRSNKSFVRRATSSLASKARRLRSASAGWCS